MRCVGRRELVEPVKHIHTHGYHTCYRYCRDVPGERRLYRKRSWSFGGSGARRRYSVGVLHYPPDHRLIAEGSNRTPFLVPLVRRGREYSRPDRVSNTMKKYIFIISAVAFAPFVALAQTATSSFELPDSFITGVWSNVEGVLIPLAPYLELIVGVVLAAVVIEVIIGAIKK